MQVAHKDDMVSLSKYDSNHATQKAITERIVNMVVKDFASKKMPIVAKKI